MKRCNSVLSGKKGVSGLIVAVLLLAISLTIGGLVIGWISGYTGDNLDEATKAQKQQDECNDLSWKVVSVSANSSNAADQSGRCWQFNVTVENQNTEDIKGYLTKFVPSSGDSLITRTNTTTSDAVGDYARKTYYHGHFVSTDPSTSCTEGMDAGQNSGFTKVEITPIIDVVVDTTVETVCTSKTKTVEKANFNSP